MLIICLVLVGSLMIKDGQYISVHPTEALFIWMFNWPHQINIIMFYLLSGNFDSMSSLIQPKIWRWFVDAQSWVYLPNNGDSQHWFEVDQRGLPQ